VAILTIRYTTADLEPNDSHVPKNDFFFKFKIVDGRRIRVLATTQPPIV